MTTKKEIVVFYHAAAGWPVKKTWIAAIQLNAYASWPGLNEYMVCRHLEVQEPTVIGHLNTRRLGTQTTKKKEKVGVEKIVRYPSRRKRFTSKTRPWKTTKLGETSRSTPSYIR